MSEGKNVREVKAAFDLMISYPNSLIRAIMMTALEDLVEDAQLPKPSRSNPRDAGSRNVTGGRMPVDTGFLRNSLIMEMHGGQLNVMHGEEKYTVFDATAGLVKWEIGQQISFGWTAVYARTQEYGLKHPVTGRTVMEGNRFLGDALDRWQGFVDNAALKLEAEIPI